MLLTYFVQKKFGMMFDIVWTTDNTLRFHGHYFVYSTINEVVDYHVNYTEENNLLIQLPYLDEF